MKTSAIAFEKIQDRALGDLTAAELIEGLGEAKMMETMIALPEKKKYELEVEPGVLGKLTVGKLVDILERFKGEKKKVEIEVPQDWIPREIPERFKGEKKKAELELEPGIRDLRVVEGLRAEVTNRLEEMSSRLANIESKLP